MVLILKYVWHVFERGLFSREGESYVCTRAFTVVTDPAEPVIFR